MEIWALPLDLLLFSMFHKALLQDLDDLRCQVRKLAMDDSLNYGVIKVNVVVTDRFSRMELWSDVREGAHFFR